MDKVFISCIFALMLTSCTTVDSVAYDPGYDSDYVYTVSHYNNRSYWNNNYYTNYNDVYDTNCGYNTNYSYGYQPNAYEGSLRCYRGF